MHIHTVMMEVGGNNREMRQAIPVQQAVPILGKENKQNYGDLLDLSLPNLRAYPGFHFIGYGRRFQNRR